VPAHRRLVRSPSLGPPASAAAAPAAAAARASTAGLRTGGGAVTASTNPRRAPAAPASTAEHRTGADLSTASGHTGCARAVRAASDAAQLKAGSIIGAEEQGLTLVHLSAQLEPCRPQLTTLHTLDIP
jgi:hypothetical protein